MTFADREEAGLLLADRLAEMILPNALVVALPRGGVPVGAQIARRLDAPLDVAFVRKLGAPDEPELAIGAVAEGDPPEIVLNARQVEELGLNEDFIGLRLPASWPPSSNAAATTQTHGRRSSPRAAP